MKLQDRLVLAAPLLAFGVALAFTTTQNAAGLAFLAWVAVGGIGRIRVPRRVPVFPHITSDTLGIGPRSDGKNFRCDGCGNLRAPADVCISPGDGYVECRTCNPEPFRG